MNLVERWFRELTSPTSKLRSTNTAKLTTKTQALRLDGERSNQIVTSADPRTARMPKWLVSVAESGLVVICCGFAGLGAFSSITCLNEGQSTEARICKTPSLQSTYFIALGVAATVALVGVIVGHLTHRWRNVFAAVGVSVAIVVITMLWGLHGVTALAR